MAISGYNQAIGSPTEKNYAPECLAQPQENTIVQNSAPSSLPQRTVDDHV